VPKKGIEVCGTHRPYRARTASLNRSEASKQLEGKARALTTPTRGSEKQRGIKKMILRDTIWQQKRGQRSRRDTKSK